MKNGIDEERLADAFVQQWSDQIFRQLRWISKKCPKDTPTYLEVMEHHGSLRIETIEFLDLILTHSAELEEALHATPTRNRTYIRKSGRKGPRRINRTRTEIFIERRWGVSSKKARQIIAELREFWQFLDSIAPCG